MGLEQVKPTWLMAVGAVALLAAGKSVTTSRTFGGTTVQIPVTGQDSSLKVRLLATRVCERKQRVWNPDCKCFVQGEVKASVMRNGNGLALALQQLNGILRV